MHTVNHHSSPVSVWVLNLSVHTNKGTESEELGEEKQKLFPGNCGPDCEGKSGASRRMLGNHPIRAVSQPRLI